MKTSFWNSKMFNRVNNFGEKWNLTRIFFVPINTIVPVHPVLRYFKYFLRWLHLIYICFSEITDYIAAYCTYYCWILFCFDFTIFIHEVKTHNSFCLGCYVSPVKRLSRRSLNHRAMFKHAWVKKTRKHCTLRWVYRNIHFQQMQLSASRIHISRDSLQKHTRQVSLTPHKQCWR